MSFSCAVSQWSIQEVIVQVQGEVVVVGSLLRLFLQNVGMGELKLPGSEALTVQVGSGMLVFVGLSAWKKNNAFLDVLGSGSGRLLGALGRGLRAPGSTVGRWLYCWALGSTWLCARQGNLAPRR